MDEFPIIEKLGGWRKVEPILIRRGVSVTQWVQQKWLQAGRLPHKVNFILALMAARRIGLDWKEGDFYIDGARGRL